MTPGHRDRPNFVHRRKRLDSIAASLASLCLALLILAPAPAEAEKIYRYRGSAGTPVFSDKPLDYGEPVEVRQVRVADHHSRFSLQRSGPDDRAALRAINGLYGPVQVEIELEEARNTAASPQLPARFVVPALGERDLVVLKRRDEKLGHAYRYSYTFVPGDPQARHRPDLPYRLPIPPGRKFRISQGFNGQTSHNGPRNRHAVDIAMPEGTPVHAARGGVIMEVARDFFNGGFDRERYGGRANFIRILHDDGTMAIYAHLKLETIRYPIGARVKVGDVLAESGNTGYSSGPHLHFVIQKNVGMALRSVPFTYCGPNGTPCTPKKGMRVWIEQEVSPRPHR